MLPNAQALALDAQPSAEGFAFSYEVDGRLAGTVQVGYPFQLDAGDHALMPAIGLVVAVFLGQLCRARTLRTSFVVTSTMVEAIRPLAEMLYDIRCWKDGVDLAPPVEIATSTAATSQPPAAVLEQKRACLLFSGGKDSSLSAVLLRKNGFDIRALHVPANLSVGSWERKAITELDPALGLRTAHLSYSFPGFEVLSDTYAATWNEFPHYNAVPFGRDLLLATLAAPFVRRSGASVLCLGHDRDCRIAHVSHRGKRIPRNDVESITGARVLEAFYRRLLVPGLTYLPPVAQLGEFRILSEMFLHYPEIMSRTAFCFWKSRCGRCAKCLRYSLAQRVLDRNGLLEFEVDPLQGETCPELVDYFASAWSADSLFSSGVSYCLARLVERGDIRPGETLLARFAAEVYPHIAPDLDHLERDLLRQHHDPQVPDDWVIDG